MRQTILVCDHSGVINSKYMTTVSPIDCLNKALETSFDLVVVNFFGVSPSNRYLYVDLCKALRLHALNVVAVMYVPHRALLVQLHNADVEYYEPLPAREYNTIPFEISPNQRLTKLSDTLADCCPMIHYIVIDEDERILCGKCNDKLVLGLRRQQEICTVKAHLGCSYFIEECDCS